MLPTSNFTTVVEEQEPEILVALARPVTDGMSLRMWRSPASVRQVEISRGRSMVGSSCTGRWRASSWLSPPTRRRVQFGHGGDQPAQVGPVSLGEAVIVLGSPDCAVCGHAAGNRLGLGRRRYRRPSPPAGPSPSTFSTAMVRGTADRQSFRGDPAARALRPDGTRQGSAVRLSSTDARHRPTRIRTHSMTGRLTRR
jgi:hypothetical protein